jgi:type I restriction enzyme S subunit
MKNNHEQTFVPKLRFPEFEDSGEWEVKSLGEILEFKNGINASKEQYGRGIKFINVLDILQNESITYEKIIGSVDVSAEIADKFSVNYGDILFQRSSETQEEVGTANVYLDREHTATFGGFVIRGKKIGEYEPIFLNKLLKSRSVRDSISSKSGGSTRFNIGQEILSSIKIFLPILPEQQKIAACLSSLDDLISAENHKLDALTAHKKGLLQHLFPAEGETVPKLRFPEFEDSGEWEEKSLGEVVSNIMTGPFGSMLHQSDYIEEGIPVVNPQNLIDGKILALSKTMIDNDTFTRLEKYALKIDDIVIARRGEMGRCAVVKTENVNWLCGTGSFVIRVNRKKIDSNFLNIILSSKRVKQELEQSSIGATMNNLNQSILVELPIILPSLLEQQKIAACLSSLDDLINAQRWKVEALKVQKKGLMQGLFPDGQGE